MRRRRLGLPTRTYARSLCRALRAYTRNAGRVVYASRINSEAVNVNAGLNIVRAVGSFSDRAILEKKGRKGGWERAGGWGGGCEGAGEAAIRCSAVARCARASQMDVRSRRESTRRRNAHDIIHGVCSLERNK